MWELEFKKLHADAIAPRRAMPNSAAFDVAAYLMSEKGRPIKRMIAARQTARIQTGICLSPPAGHYLMVASRSGMASKGIFVANAPGIVDPDYTGEIIVLLYNGGFEPYYVEHEHRVAQILVVPLPVVTLREVQDFPPTERGAAGFGSTGA